ncbi:MAG: hypothetical protein J6C96_11075 [Oscillospiraceae bacterium]|nr:hypothetical protein [Oscillospiraceae bacterium]
MRVAGIQYTPIKSSDNSKNEFNYTLHVMDKFPEYLTNSDSGRGCSGMMVSTVYAGNYDCKDIKPGMEIEIYFDKAVSTSKGVFQTVKKIEIVKAN